MIRSPAFVEHDARIPTWFGVGGRADRLAGPRSIDELRECLRIEPDPRVLGDGANLLVHDDGIDRLVVTLGSTQELTRVEHTGDGLVRVGAGCDLFKTINRFVREGWGGLEMLGGIPASVGGAVRMNAGGAFGEIADVIERVHGIDREGRELVRERDDIPFGYRRSGLTDLIITAVELRVCEEDPSVLRERLKRVLAYKKRTQPMKDNSAGCCFKNPDMPSAPGPELASLIAREGIDPSKTHGRISAGLLIDRAGCKGERSGGARVSCEHANFIVTDKDSASARDVLRLMDVCAQRVHETFGVRLEREVVVWTRGDAHA